MPMIEYFGRPEGEASISFSLDSSWRAWSYQNKRWEQTKSDNKMRLNGFYEGSIIFGNRFKDTEFNVIRKLDHLNYSDMDEADEFVRINLGMVLHDDSNYYEKLYIIKKATAVENRLSGRPYFLKIQNDKFISQARMSTGENLLISILNSLNIVRDKREKHNDGRPCIVFLDEIELALHASALRRLVYFLEKISKELNLSIFFSTHSLELIRGIKPQNIYYLTRMFDGSISVTNPCYPAYATRNLYSDDGYGEDVVIFVEDDLAKIILEKIMFEKQLLKNIRVKILPTGGWTNTIMMAHDVISSKLLLRDTKVLVVLDKDIEKDVPKFAHNNKKYKDICEERIDYLPINSLEKYLQKNLITKFNQDLFEMLDTYLFQKNPLAKILRDYTSKNDVKEDKDGKTLYGLLENELRGIRKDREDLVQIVVKFLVEKEKESLEPLEYYLKMNLSPV